MLYACKQKPDAVFFMSYLYEPCMIVNYEQDNRFEGKYLKVRDIYEEDNLFIVEINLPYDFFINPKNNENWLIGWGNNEPLYDSGMENLREILDINGDIVKLGEIRRGEGVPEINQRVVFWNTKPSGFYNHNKKPIINLDKWDEFNGNQAFLGVIEFDSIHNKWIMLFNEVSENRIQIYAAESSNLKDWYPANDGKPVLTPEDFACVNWAGTDITGEFGQTPYPSDILRYNDNWYLFFYGYCKQGKRNIGLAVSDSSVIGPYKVYEKPLITPGGRFSWENTDCLFAKVAPYNNRFVMFFLGKNSKGRGHEKIGMAFSEDLYSWEKYENNPVINTNTGWRSCEAVSEPVFLEIRNDSIFLMILGAKKFKMGFWHRRVTKRMYMDKSGNVDDNQVGLYLSTDGGKTFTAHKNNPIFINDYSNIYESEHMGGGFKYIKTDSSEMIFYQAKSLYKGESYNIMMRERK